MRQIHANDRTVYRFIYTIAFILGLASTTLAQPPAGYEALFIGHSFSDLLRLVWKCIPRRLASWVTARQ
jgi:hypothetical protein